MRILGLLRYLRRHKDEREDFLLASDTVPRYVAIIMDGNGRWAADRRLPAIAGHREGAKALKRAVKASRKAAVEELTVYAFSTENWRRPQQEIDGLMELFSGLIEKEVPELHQQGIRIRFIGRRHSLSHKIQQQMAETEALTRDNNKMTLFVAFNYGGRAEIIDAMKAACSNGGNEENFADYLYAPDMHDPELLIRTSGEQRLSNFLLWQSAYSELFFSDKLWPDFDERELDAAFVEFGRRQRRFGAR